MNRTTAEARATLDRYETILRKSLEVISQSDTLEKWLTNLEADMHNRDIDMAERLEANAMLVGVMYVMLNKIEDDKEAP